ncbi:MAG: hypothetical protein U0230_22230 [Polyangiales bacterium]
MTLTQEALELPQVEPSAKKCPVPMPRVALALLLFSSGLAVVHAFCQLGG